MGKQTGPTLEQLENDDWGEPEFSSHLVTTCHHLRRKPLDDFAAEDLRIMIGQNFSLDHLVPRAITLLRINPLASGDFYEGDLLQSVIKCDLAKTADKERLREELADICTEALEQGKVEFLKERQDAYTAEELGLSEDVFTELLEQEWCEELKQSPWRECVEFIDTYYKTTSQ